MTGCEPIWELISTAVDGALTPREQTTLEDHLAQCPACRELYHQMQGMTDGLGELTAPGKGFVDEVMGAVAHTEQDIPFTNLDQNRDIHAPGREQMKAWWRPIRRAAALVACCLIVVGVWRMAGVGGGSGFDSAAPQQENSMAAGTGSAPCAAEDVDTADSFSRNETALVVDGVEYYPADVMTDRLPEGYTLAGTTPDGLDYFAHPQQEGIYLAEEKGYSYWIAE